jgi:hypothetical protein
MKQKMSPWWWAVIVIALGMWVLFAFDPTGRFTG